MYQILILIAVIALVYLIARSARPKVNLSEKSTEMVRCQKCNLNLPKSDAILSGKVWLCSSECQT